MARRIPLPGPAHGGTLLDRARLRWQFGDWEGLAGLDPFGPALPADRAEMALLAACAHLQLGDAAAAGRLAALAKDGGCDRALIAGLLVAGARHNLGRAQAALAAPPPPPPGAPDEPRLRLAAGKFLRGGDAAKAQALDDFAALIRESTGEPACPPLSWLALGAAGQCFNIVHVKGDYIPDRIGQEGRFYEQDFLDALAGLSPPGSVVVDAGANIGNHTLYFAGVLRREVAAFEPEPHNYACLSANVALNGLLPRVRRVRCGLGEREGSVTLRMAAGDNYGTFSARPAGGGKGGAPAAAVPVKPLDLALREAGVERPVSILKIDVEGMERSVLAGALKTVAASLPAIGLECTAADELRRVEALLRKFGYFPCEVFNATPTFLLLSRGNPLHIDWLAARLRAGSLRKALKSKYFSAATKP